MSSLPITCAVERRRYAAFSLLRFDGFDSLHRPAGLAGGHPLTIMNEIRTWFYADGEQTVGPVDAAEIEHLIRESAVAPSTWMLAEGTDDWVLAQDSPFAAHLGSASSQQGPPDQTTVDSAPTLTGLDAPPSVEGEQPHETLSAKFSQLGSAVFSETKRSARLASIKAIIEKLKHVDLTKAHYALGKKAYELKIDQDQFSDQYREVSTLEEIIKAKKEGNAPYESATVMENFRGAAINAKAAVEAEAFEIKRKRWFIKIGKEYRSASVPTALKAEFEAVAAIERRIQESKAEFVSVSVDHRSLPKIGDLARNIFRMFGARIMVTRSKDPDQLEQLVDPRQQPLRSMTGTESDPPHSWHPLSEAAKRFAGSRSRFVLASLGLALLVLLSIYVGHRPTASTTRTSFQTRSSSGSTSTRLAGGTPAVSSASTEKSFPVKDDIAAGATEITPTHEVEAARAELNRINQEVERAKPLASDDPQQGRLLHFNVQFKLDPTKFGWRRFIPGADIYQIQISPYDAQHRDGDGTAVLQKFTDQYTSSGAGSMYVKFVDTLSVKMADGFEKEVPVYEESSQEETMTLKAKDQKMGELLRRQATLQQNIDESVKRQHIFEYAAKKFSTVHLAPVCHVSRRLQELGFAAQLASAQWDRIVELIKQADWQGIAKEVGGTNSDMVSESDVDNMFERLEKLPVTVAIKSPRSHLFVITGGGGGSYLEPPKQHRVVAVASLSLPTNASNLYNSMMYKRVDLGTIPDLENLRKDALPDEDGYVAKWKPMDTDIYFCVDLWFGDAGENSASTEFDTLRRAVTKECEDIKRRSELGTLPKGEVSAAITHSLDQLYDYAAGTLMANF